ncbi:unnamed protein product [Arabidopsis lyrata]|nr:unnamed protein product [Arabidopsis lyrata]
MRESNRSIKVQKFVPFDLRFMIDCNIVGGNWIEVPCGKYKKMSKPLSYCQLEFDCLYVVLGQACYHLGLMEDAMILLQTSKSLATAALHRESYCLSDDSFILSTSASQPPSMTESEIVSQMLSQIKIFIRRRTAALAAFDAGLYSESIRHFSKIVESRRGAPQSFLAYCLIRRASAYKSAGRLFIFFSSPLLT